MVDDTAVPRCTHKVEVVGTGKELGLEGSSATLKRHPTQAEVMDGTTVRLLYLYLRYGRRLLLKLHTYVHYCCLYSYVDELQHWRFVSVLID